MNTTVLKQFIQAAESVNTHIDIVSKNPTKLNDALLNITRHDASVLLAQPDDIDEGLFSVFRINKNVFSHPTDLQIADTQFGVTDAFAGIARTGSVCVSISKNMGSTFSLFANTHIAVLEIENILPRPRDIFLKEPYRSKSLTRDFLFISGSSATADMGPLVRGVHGPAQLSIILLQ